MDISQSLSCIIWHSHPCLPLLPGYQPLLTFHSPLRLFLPISLNWFFYLHPFASQVTQSLGDLSYSTAFNCYLYAEDTLDPAPELLIANHLLNQSPQIVVPLGHYQLIISETEAAFTKHVRGREWPVASKPIGFGIRMPGPPPLPHHLEENVPSCPS